MSIHRASGTTTTLYSTIYFYSGRCPALYLKYNSHTFVISQDLIRFGKFTRFLNEELECLLSLFRLTSFYLNAS